MEPVLTLNVLSTKAYNASLSKGWYEGESRSDSEIAQLIVSEIVEASEEVRNRKPKVYVVNDGKDCELEHLGFESCTVIGTTPEHPTENRILKYLKPEGESIELADGLIRIGDYFGAHGLDLAQSMQQTGVVDKLNDLTLLQAARACEEFMGHQFTALRPLSAHLKIIRILSHVDAGMSARRAFGEAAVAILAYAHLKGHDIEAAVKLKMKFNETRPHRHGNKAL